MIQDFRAILSLSEKQKVFYCPDVYFWIGYKAKFTHIYKLRYDVESQKLWCLWTQNRCSAPPGLFTMTIKYIFCQHPHLHADKQYTDEGTQPFKRFMEILNIWEETEWGISAGTSGPRAVCGEAWSQPTHDDINSLSSQKSVTPPAQQTRERNVSERLFHPLKPRT